MTTDLSYYGRAIAAQFLCDTATAVLVEELMRSEYGTLDGLTPGQFASGAADAYGDAVVMADMGELAGFCEALGIEVPGMLAKCEGCGALPGQECDWGCSSNFAE